MKCRPFLLGGTAFCRHNIKDCLPHCLLPALTCWLLWQARGFARWLSLWLPPSRCSDCCSKASVGSRAQHLPVQGTNRLSCILLHPIHRCMQLCAPSYQAGRCVKTLRWTTIWVKVVCHRRLHSASGHPCHEPLAWGSPVWWTCKAWTKTNSCLTCRKRPLGAAWDLAEGKPFSTIQVPHYHYTELLAMLAVTRFQTSYKLSSAELGGLDRWVGKVNSASPSSISSRSRMFCSPSPLREAHGWWEGRFVAQVARHGS